MLQGKSLFYIHSLYNEDKGGNIMFKKFFGACMCLALMATLVGCKPSFKAQEKVVNSFFTDLAAGDVDKVNALCTSSCSAGNSLTSFSSTFSSYLDETRYGKTFVSEAKKFKTHVFNKLIVSKKLKSMKTDSKKKNQVVATITGRMRDYDTVTLASYTMSSYATSYQTQHKAELQKYYLAHGYSATLIKIYTDLAPTLFAKMEELTDAATQKNFTCTMTIVKSGDSQKISDIKMVTK